MIDFLQDGPGWSVLALTGARAATGVFFATSGLHKLFWAERRAMLRETLAADLGKPAAHLWFVVAGLEFAAGITLALGVFTAASAAVLMGIMLVALCCECSARIREYAPIDKLDWLCDLLYLPETLLAILLGVFAAIGGGAWAVDALY